jgi:hypothetical protein
MDTLPFLSFRVALAVKVRIVLNWAWSLLKFRSGYIKALIEKGHEVVPAAPQDEHVSALQAIGASFVKALISLCETNRYTFSCPLPNLQK